ncbi:ImmA/IrrE family metallo-endopeptidase [Glycomyces sp. NPDC048151]|uniref:ImmA/IrrE family metallo-endopeptidase n=1 Tax=Glycomyces sp. NPDC048151 TaxID=3364002 RepID=UPI00371DB714
MIPPREVVRQQADDMVAGYRRLHPESFAALSIDPIEVLSADHDVVVLVVSELGEAGTPEADRCSVAGMYLEEYDPPRLRIAAAASAGRRAFTALHEFGHHLQRTDDGLGDRLEGLPDQGVMLEEAACDLFAAKILLPDDRVAAHLGAPGPTAPAVVDLWKASASASRAAVCVRAAQALPAPGHVVLLGTDGRISFSSSKGLPPLRRASDQSGVPTIRDALRRGGRAKGRTRLRYRDGIEGEELYAQIAPMDGYLLLIAVTDSAPWESFSLPSRQPATRGASWVCSTPGCDAEFVAYERPCEHCGQPSCPHCGRCGCSPKTVERRCSSCNLLLPLRMYLGDSNECVDCH